MFITEYSGLPENVFEWETRKWSKEEWKKEKKKKPLDDDDGRKTCDASKRERLWWVMLRFVDVPFVEIHSLPGFFNPSRAKWLLV